MKDGERLYSKSWSGGTPIAREVAEWLGFDDPKHEVGKLIQRITKGTLRATEAWIDGRYAEDDKHVELDCELAVALANATEVAARATVLRITQTEPSHGFVAWQALVHGYATKSSKDPAIALQPVLATPKKCKDAKELKERLTVWSLKVAEYEHQFKTIDEAQKIFVVREMMPMDINQEFLTGPRKFDETMEKLEIIVNEMMADDGPMDLVNVGLHDTKTTQSDSDTSNDMSHEDVCATAWKGYKAGKGAGQEGTEWMGTHGIVGKQLRDGGKTQRQEGLQWPRAANPIGTVTRTREKTSARARARVKPDTATTAESRGTSEQTIHTSGNSIDEEDDQTSSWESEPGGENAEGLASLEKPDEEGECWPKKSRVTRW